jgi:hypothetical protein
MVIVVRIDGRMYRHGEVIGIISQIALRIEHYSCNQSFSDQQMHNLLTI